MEKYVVYKNRFNEVKPYWIRVDGENEQELAVFDLTENKRKTFKISQVLHETINMEEARNAAQMEQSKVEIIPPEFDSLKAKLLIHNDLNFKNATTRAITALFQWVY